MTEIGLGFGAAAQPLGGPLAVESAQRSLARAHPVLPTGAICCLRQGCRHDSATGGYWYGLCSGASDGPAKVLSGLPASLLAKGRNLTYRLTIENHDQVRLLRTNEEFASILKVAPDVYVTLDSSDGSSLVVSMRISHDLPYAALGSRTSCSSRCGLR